MQKIHTTLTIDDEILKQAKEKLINVSEFLEESLKEKLGNINLSIKNTGKCDFCGREFEKATAEKPNGLNWLWPDEKWICNSCLRTAVNSVPIEQK